MMTPGKIRRWAGWFLCLGSRWANRVAAMTTAATQVLNRQYIFHSRISAIHCCIRRRMQYGSV